ncbi:hypothetical protein B0H11DRAFT_1928859 [Mycena galericulata]|nr:hypothetical protein B0H11DRAFT_1928859 [Mycena galericulata]
MAPKPKAQAPKARGRPPRRRKLHESTTDLPGPSVPSSAAPDASTSATDNDAQSDPSQGIPLDGEQARQALLAAENSSRTLAAASATGKRLFLNAVPHEERDGWKVVNRMPVENLAPWFDDVLNDFNVYEMLPNQGVPSEQLAVLVRDPPANEGKGRSGEEVQAVDDGGEEDPVLDDEEEEAEDALVPARVPRGGARVLGDIAVAAGEFNDIMSGFRAAFASSNTAQEASETRAAPTTQGTAEVPVYQASPSRKNAAVLRAQMLETWLNDSDLALLLDILGDSVSKADTYNSIQREGVRISWVQAQLRKHMMDNGLDLTM